MGVRRRWWRSNDSGLPGSLFYLFPSFVGYKLWHRRYYGFLCTEGFGNYLYHGWACDQLQYCSLEDYLDFLIIQNWHQHLSGDLFQLLQANTRLWLPSRISMVAMKDSSAFGTIKASNLSTSCVILYSIISLTSRRVIDFPNVGSGAKWLAMSLPRLVSILSDSWSSRFVKRVPCSNVFSPRPIGQYSPPLDDNVSIACWTRCYGLSIEAIGWEIDLRALGSVLFHLPHWFC